MKTSTVRRTEPRPPAANGDIRIQQLAVRDGLLGTWFATPLAIDDVMQGTRAAQQYLSSKANSATARESS